MSRRHKLEIVAELLRLLKKSRKKTQLVYKANLNFTIIKKYLALLFKHGLVQVEDDIYMATAKGIAFVDGYDHLMAELGITDSTEM